MRLYFSAGLYSSGSTWVYNIALALLKNQGKFLSIYSDNLNAYFEYTDADIFLVKCHSPDFSLRFLAKASNSPVLLSVRDPRDAVTSYMQRFSSPFEVALENISTSATALYYLSHSVAPTKFVYESRFMDNQGSIETIASALGVRLEPDLVRQLMERFHHASVRRHIDTLVADGTLGQAPPISDFEPETHWHPGHVGDLRINKYNEYLTSSQVEQITAATSDYCQRFGY